MAKAEYKSAVRSRQKIVAAVVDLLQEKPLGKITVTDVVKRANINRGTFYMHYRDVPDVIDHQIQKVFDRIKAAMPENCQDINVFTTALLGQIQMLLEEDPEYYSKIMNSSAAQIVRRQMTQVLLEYLMQHEADFSRGDHEQFVMNIRFCAGGLSVLFMDWFEGKLPISLQKLTERAGQMITRFLRTE